MRLRKRDFENLAADEFNTFRASEPNHSGNMANNATKLEYDGNTAIIRIDADIAPYSVYTVISWADTSPIIKRAPKRPELLGKSSFLWNNGDKPFGTPKKNPNEGWIDRAVFAMALSIANKLKGKMEWNF